MYVYQLPASCLLTSYFWKASVPSRLSNNFAGRDPVVSSKRTLPLLSWYNGLPFSQQRRVVGSKGRCVCVLRVCVFKLQLVVMSYTCRVLLCPHIFRHTCVCYVISEDTFISYQLLCCRRVEFVESNETCDAPISNIM